MALGKDKVKEFRRIGHNLKPTIIVGDAGLSAGVTRETERALDDHELIKVKLNCASRDQKHELARELCASLNCELVQSIGNIILIYRKPDGDPPKLSNILKFYTKDA